jgi:hypothetical protein
MYEIIRNVRAAANCGEGDTQIRRRGAALALRMGNVTINHDAEKVSLFRTRHSITGTLGTFERHQNDRDRSTVVGVGVLRAPDHQPLELKTPHILAQAEYLYEPAKAD